MYASIPTSPHTKLLVICTVLCALQVSPGLADTPFMPGSGYELELYCTAANEQANNEDWHICVTYVDATASGFAMAGELTKAVMSGVTGKVESNEVAGVLKIDMLLNTRYCIPPKLNRSDVALAVIKWLDAHPDKLKEPYAAGIVLALSQTWPCLSPQAK